MPVAIHSNHGTTEITAIPEVAESTSCKFRLQGRTQITAIHDEQARWTTGMCVREILETLFIFSFVLTFYILHLVV